MVLARLVVLGRVAMEEVHQLFLCPTLIHLHLHVILPVAPRAIITIFHPSGINFALKDSLPIEADHTIVTSDVHLFWFHVSFLQQVNTERVLMRADHLSNRLVG